MRKIGDFIKSLLNVDFPDNAISGHSQDELTRILLVNYLSVITIFNMLLYIGIYSILDFNVFKPAIYFLSLSSLLTFGVIFINKNGFYNTAKILLASLASFSMTFIAAYVFDKSPGFHVYLLLAAIIPVFMWSIKQKGYLIFFITIYILIYLFLEFSTLTFRPLIIMPEKYVGFFHSSNIIVCFVGMGAGIGFYQWLINKKEKQLLDQAKDLKESQKHKDLVYSIIAHDLKGPISTFVGLTDYFLKDYKTGDEARLLEIVKRINEKSGSLYILLGNLLDWSKMQSGNLSYNKSDFNIKQIIEDAVRVYHEISESKEQNIEIEIDDKLQLNADQYMISTVIRNLISNAIKFTPQKGNILVRAIVKDEETEICVSDSGVGIIEKDLLDLFEAQKTNDDFVVKSDGGGLGLIICKDFVESNGGRIWVESEEEKGSKFYFTIPNIDSTA